MELQKEWGSYAVLQVSAEALQNEKFDEDLRLTAKEAALLEKHYAGPRPQIHWSSGSASTYRSRGP